MAENMENDSKQTGDIGIWVCEASGILISPSLFMQSVCKDFVPSLIRVKWHNYPGLPPKPFQRMDGLPVLYGKVGQIPLFPGDIHLFSAQEPTRNLFERAGVLSDWQFPVQIRGIVVLLESKRDYQITRQILKQAAAIFHQTLDFRNQTLAWCEKQALPTVIALMEDANEQLSEEAYRSRHEIQDNDKVLIGPALGKERVKNEGGVFGGLIQLGGLRVKFDEEYGRRILVEMMKEIGK